MVKQKYKIDFRRNFSIYLDLIKPYKWQYALVLLFGLVFQILHVGERLLFKIIIDDGTAFASGTILRSEFISVLIFIAVVYAGIVLTNSVGRFFWIHFINKIETLTMADLKRFFFSHILHLSFDFHTTHRTGSLVSKILRGNYGIERTTDVIVFEFGPLTFQLLVSIISIWYFDALSALVIFVTSLVFVGSSFYISHKQQTATVAANESEDAEKGQLSDYFTNIDSIKYFGKETVIKNQFFSITERVRKTYLKAWNYHRWQSMTHNFVLGLGSFFLLYFPMVRLLNGETTIGTVTFIYTLYISILGHLFGVDRGIRDFYRAMADFESLFFYQRITNEIVDKPNAPDLRITKGVIEFKDVTFRYKQRRIFSNFNLTIPKNKKVALVGHSGVGKSTIVKLIYRLYDIESGEILIDGVNIKDVKQESLRSELSIVPQEAVLFDDTIYNNIAFSNPRATRKEVFAAMKFAQLDRFVNTLPKKERTIVGERGVKLSGGEKQRVSIARAILADKKILVLDEATSSLDSHTEHEIQRDLHKLMEGRTAVIIAHRLSTIMQADIIVVMEKGRIVQMGTHKELIKKHGAYKKLWNLQRGGYIIT